ncbi:MAG: Gfo/Idh/MocA family oxidoreductase [Candidatus Glassbacteria bacterium]|nr:Gfo/Idh/MocA family oxidoreductase [Candidatus Glassbacteria bacterium]
MKGKSRDELRAGPHPDRREFLRSLGAASLGLMAAGAASAQDQEVKPAPLLDPRAPVRIGVIGRQGHLYEVFNALDKIPGAKITAYAFEDGDWEFNSDGTRRGGSYDLEPMRKWAEEQSWFGPQTRLYETYQQMLDREDLDVAVVCLPYARNPFAAAAAAGHGLHVFCEKPVAVNHADLDMLEASVKKSGVRLSAMFTMRTSPTIATIRQGVSQGLVGKVCLARAQKSYIFGEERPWFYKHREIYGSTILWVGIHAIDYIRWTTGLEIRKVAATHANLAHPDYPGCQDSAVVMMELDGGAKGAVTCDYLRPDKAPTHGDDRLRVIGSKGVLETKDLDRRVELITQDQGPRDLENVGPVSLFADFIGSLRGQNRHIVDPDDAVRVTRICISATEAADRGEFIGV